LIHYVLALQVIHLCWGKLQLLGNIQHFHSMQEKPQQHFVEHLFLVLGSLLSQECISNYRYSILKLLEDGFVLTDLLLKFGANDPLDDPHQNSNHNEFSSLFQSDFCQQNPQKPEVKPMLMH
jgi:hypothetical protein